jgi:hypothetical protein
MAAALVDQFGVLAVAVGQRAEHPGAHDVGKAHDGVQRRAQLVAHIGQEAGAAGGQAFGLGPRLLQGGFAGPVDRGVAHHPDQQVGRHLAQLQADRAGRVQQRREGDGWPRRC